LFHGPTLSFKDVGARCLAAFLKRIPEGPGQTIFVATSGDTGSAVADAFSQSGAFQVALLFPEHGVSKLQKLQLTLERPGVRAFAIDGTFDDCQRLVKTAFADFDNAHLRPGSANSINIGRLLPQMLYYIHAAAIVNQPFEVAVPSGNLGNITSAWFAQQSGAPIKRLIAAHNANHPFTTFVETGNYLPGATVPTLSNAMDVGAPSNFERLRSLLSDQAFKSTFRSGFCTDAETLAAMATSFQNGYIADPHTSVGLHVSHGLRNPSLPLLVAATAHPAKFPDAFVEAKLPVPQHPELAKLAHEKHQVIRCSPEYNTFKSTVHEAFRVR
jgi:threonine synthase